MVKFLIYQTLGMPCILLAGWLLADGLDVVALDDLSGGYADNVPAGARFVRASVTDHQSLARLEADFRGDAHAATSVVQSEGQAKGQAIAAFVTLKEGDSIAVFEG